MNNKKNNRKGFTIVELVIVIAVIAILATVLVPTFSGVVSSAKDSAALQEARNAYTNYTVANAKSDSYRDDMIVKISDTQFVVINDGAVKDKIYATVDAAAADVNTYTKTANNVTTTHYSLLDVSTNAGNTTLTEKTKS